MGFRGILKTGKLCQSFCPKGFYTRLNLQAEIDNLINDRPLEVFEYIEELPYESQEIKINKGNTKLLHLTDIHLDLNYTANSSTVCDFPICCHEEHGFPEGESSKAPEFGSSKCDTPLKLFESGLDFIRQEMSDVDGVLITGDFSAHNEWEKTPQTVLKVREMVEERIKETLNVEMITAPGNNEYLPDHQVDPTSNPE
jgi:sphingomyelin phosphodiesterase